MKPHDRQGAEEADDDAESAEPGGLQLGSRPGGNAKNAVTTANTMTTNFAVPSAATACCRDTFDRREALRRRLRAGARNLGFPGVCPARAGLRC